MDGFRIIGLESLHPDGTQLQDSSVGEDCSLIGAHAFQPEHLAVIGLAARKGSIPIFCVCAPDAHGSPDMDEGEFTAFVQAVNGRAGDVKFVLKVGNGKKPH